MSKHKFREEVISIKGMSCRDCSEKIQSMLTWLNGVERVRVSLIENKAFVKFDPEIISLEQIKTEINEMGYSADGITKKDTTLKQGIVYGLVPHIGCIGFIAASILGVTVAVNFFRPLLMNPWFFHILVALSIGFATVSSVIYLRKQGFLSQAGVKRKWKYLSTMYGSTIGINLVLFMIIFPLLANVSLSETVADGTSSIRLVVDIPCPGHAPLISGELKTLSGVEAVQFSFPNIFDIKYDATKTTKQDMLALEVFDTYRATVIDENIREIQPKVTASSGCGCGRCGSTGSCCGVY